jgi:signal recognition particle GTPase
MSEPQTPASRMAYAQQMLAIIDKRLVELPYEATWETRLSLTDARKHYIIMFGVRVHGQKCSWAQLSIHNEREK